MHVDVITTNLDMLAKTFPGFSNILLNCKEEVLEKAHIPKGNHYSRIFLAIDSGLYIDKEIANNADIKLAECKKLLAAMVSAGELITVSQGGKTDSARGDSKTLYVRAKQ